MSTDTTTRPTVDDLRLGLPQVLDSPRDEGLVEMLVVRPAEDVRETPPTVAVSADHGVHGDHWATGRGRDRPDTQITIINSRLLDLVSGDRKRWSLAGDNIVADLDISHANLVPGQKLAIGTAVLEISEPPHTGCSKFASRFGADALRFVNLGPGKDLRLRGIYARVFEPGSIAVGDRIRRL